MSSNAILMDRQPGAGDRSLSPAALKTAKSDGLSEGYAYTPQERAEAFAVQQRFMGLAPSTDAIDYSARCRQIGDLGGDCFDFVPLAGARISFTVGDASGKGLPAALMISNVQSSLRTAALLAGNDAAAVLTAVNRNAYATSLTDRYATVFYAVLDPATRTLRYVNAGHTPPLVLHRDGSVEWLETGGAPVGMFSDWAYQEGAVQLNAGDVVVACSDGVTEVENPAGEMWGVQGLETAAARNHARSAADLVDAIFHSMDEFSRGRQTDDATVAVLKIQ